MLKIEDFSDEPKYNIKTVSQNTGIETVTLRAWERRYQIINPQRADNGYRLYSERDIALLSWLKNKVEAGISISSAITDFRLGVEQGNWPEAVINPAAPLPSKRSLVSSAEMVRNIFHALTTHNETVASSLFEEALASYDLVNFFEKVLSPVLVEIGDAWYHGKIQVATEHFASSFIRSKLMAIFQSMPALRNRSYMMVGGAPGELHEIGILMLSVLLREAGYQVEYLGPDLPLEDLVYYVKDEHPKMVILSATLKDSIEELGGFDHMLKEIKPKPLFGYGGPAFNRHPELIPQTPGKFLGQSLSQSLLSVRNLIEKKPNHSLV